MAAFEDAPDPFELFDLWLGEAKESETNDPTAMAVATVGADGMPSLRMVLLKHADAEGFVFYTNYESRKGGELLSHPKAALLFHWKSRRRQVRVEGAVVQVSDEEADDYFASRPRQSQIGAWASQQSRPLEGRLALEKRVALYAAKFALGKVPRPPYWSGFRILPSAFEFWQDGAFRLHDRVRYTPLEASPESNSAWQRQRLYP
ncbi:MAG: pyridoxamine 5'-phosphate oxidase [Rhodospirillales bacterium]